MLSLVDLVIASPSPVSSLVGRTRFKYLRTLINNPTIITQSLANSARMHSSLSFARKNLCDFSFAIYFHSQNSQHLMTRKTYRKYGILLPLQRRLCMHVT